MVLTLGMVVVCFAVAGLAVDGTRVFLARRTLQNVADAAALAGASEVDQGGLYRSGGRVIDLDPDEAERQARLVLVKRGIPVMSSVSAGPEGVRVEVRESLPTSFLGLVGISHIQVGAVAEAAPLAGSG